MQHQQQHGYTYPIDLKRSTRIRNVRKTHKLIEWTLPRQTTDYESYFEWLPMELLDELSPLLTESCLEFYDSFLYQNRPLTKRHMSLMYNNYQNILFRIGHLSLNYLYHEIHKFNDLISNLIYSIEYFAEHNTSKCLFCHTTKNINYNLFTYTMQPLYLGIVENPTRLIATDSKCYTFQFSICHECLFLKLHPTPFVCWNPQKKQLYLSINNTNNYVISPFSKEVVSKTHAEFNDSVIADLKELLFTKQYYSCIPFYFSFLSVF